MDKKVQLKSDFYEKFWSDSMYTEDYAFDSAVRDRFPAIVQVWGTLRKPASVLDFGCGNGVLTYWLKSNGFGDCVTGVDVSKTGVENARKAFRVPGLRYETVDYVDQVDDYFDVIVSSHVLEHIEKPEIALQKLIHKADWFVFEVPLEDCLWPQVSCFLRGKDRTDNPVGHVNFWNKKTFNEFIKSENLFVVRDYHYASAPYSKFNPWVKRFFERFVLFFLGLELYSKLMSTHYIVLARRVSADNNIEV